MLFGRVVFWGGSPVCLFAGVTAWVVLACGALQFRRPGSTVQAVEGFHDDKQPSASEVSDGSAESRCLIREKVLWLRMQVVKKMWSEVA